MFNKHVTTPPRVNYVIHHKPFTRNLCTADYDCDLPYRCCRGIFFNYCCTENGKGFRATKRKLFPNITLPELPIPEQFPQPIPIPYL